MNIAYSRTVSVEKGGVKLSRQQRIRHVPQELFEQRRHVVHAVLLVQLDVHPHVEVFTQLLEHTQKPNAKLQILSTNAKKPNGAGSLKENACEGKASAGVKLGPISPQWIIFLNNRISHFISLRIINIFAASSGE